MFYDQGLCQTYNVLISSGRIKTPAAGMRCWPIIWNTIKMIYADRYKVARNTLQHYTSHTITSAPLSYDVIVVRWGAEARPELIRFYHEALGEIP